MSQTSCMKLDLAFCRIHSASCTQLTVTWKVFVASHQHVTRISKHYCPCSLIDDSIKTTKTSQPQQIKQASATTFYMQPRFVRGKFIPTHPMMVCRLQAMPTRKNRGKACPFQPWKHGRGFLLLAKDTKECNLLFVMAGDLQE